MDAMMRISERMFPEEFLVRANAVRGKKVFGNYCSRGETGEIQEILCKCCHTSIANFAPIDITTRKTDDGQLVQTIRERFKYAAIFCRVQFTLTDESTLTSNMCIDCAKKFNDADKELLEALYIADHEAFAWTDEREGWSKEEFAEKHARRLGLEIVPGSKRILGG